MLGDQGRGPAAEEPLVEELAVRLEAVVSSELELRSLLRSAHTRIAAHEDEIARLRSQSTLQVELDARGHELAGLRAEVARISEQLEAQSQAAARHADASAAGAHAVGALTAERDALRQEVERLAAELHAAVARIEAMRATRLWKLGTAWWTLRTALRGG